MQTERAESKWNELQFVSWAEFKNMAPTILQLEVARMGKLIDDHAGAAGGVEFRNALVAFRFALRRFIAALRDADQAEVAEKCTPYLGAAIMSFPATPDDFDDAAKETCKYILDRLKYINGRIGLIY